MGNVYLVPQILNGMVNIVNVRIAMQLNGASVNLTQSITQAHATVNPALTSSVEFAQCEALIMDNLFQDFSIVSIKLFILSYH